MKRKKESSEKPKENIIDDEEKEEEEEEEKEEKVVESGQKRKRTNPARKAKIAERWERYQHTLKRCLGATLKNGRLGTALDATAIAVGRARHEASLLLQLHLARCAEAFFAEPCEFPAIRDYLRDIEGEKKDFFRRLMWSVVSTDRTEKNRADLGVQETFTHYYTPLRPATLPVQNRSCLHQLYTYAADEMSVAMSNHVLLPLVGRFRKCCKYRLDQRAPLVALLSFAAQRWKLVDWIADRVFSPKLPVSVQQLLLHLPKLQEAPTEELQFVLAIIKEYRALLDGTQVPTAKKGKYPTNNEEEEENEDTKKSKMPHWTTCFLLHAALARFVEAEHLAQRVQGRQQALRAFSLSPHWDPRPASLLLDTVGLYQLARKIESDPSTLPAASDVHTYKTWLWDRYFRLGETFGCSVQGGPIFHASLRNGKEVEPQKTPLLETPCIAPLHSGAKRRFEFTVRSDGVTLCIHQSSAVEGVDRAARKKQKGYEEWVETTKQRAHTGNILKTLVEKTAKEGSTIAERYRVVGLDPGRKSLGTWARSDLRQPGNPARYAVQHISTREWHHLAGTKRREQATKRRKAGKPLVELILARMPSGKVGTLDSTLSFVAYHLEHAAVLGAWWGERYHRRAAMNSYTDRQVAMDGLVRRILNPTPSLSTGEPKGKEGERNEGWKKKRVQERKPRVSAAQKQREYQRRDGPQRSLEMQEKGKKTTIVAFGDGMFSSTSKGAQPGPYKRLFSVLRRQPSAIVVKFNEHRSSCVCPTCEGELDSPYGLGGEEKKATAEKGSKREKGKRVKIVSKLEKQNSKKRGRDGKEKEEGAKKSKKWIRIPPLYPVQEGKEEKKEGEGEEEKRWKITGVRVCTHTQCRTFWDRDVAASLNILRGFLYAVSEEGGGTMLPAFWHHTLRAASHSNETNSEDTVSKRRKLSSERRVTTRNSTTSSSLLLLSGRIF
jgi:hypothetical protein